MKVSVIIPVYNVVHYIERCLLSALDQTWQELEIILVNDATPDDSMEVVEKVLAVHPRRSCVKVLTHPRNRGLSAARNTALREATGDYVFFLDSDDYLPRRSIERLAEAASGENVDFVVGNYEVTGGRRNTPPLRLPTGLLADNRRILETFAGGGWYVMAWSKLVSRSFLLRKRLFFQEGLVHEDDLWSFKMACLARRAYIVNEVTYFYYIQPDSITGRPSIRNLESRVEIIRLLFDFITSSELLRANRFVYLAFESFKAKYFDRILYFSRDEVFRRSAYDIFREKAYLTAFQAGKQFHPGWLQTVRNFHYAFSPSGGYRYFKGIVKLEYYVLVFPIKWRQWFGRKKK